MKLGHVRGEYKDDIYEVIIRETGDRSEIYCNGVKINDCTLLVITLKPNLPTEITVKRLSH